VSGPVRYASEDEQTLVIACHELVKGDGFSRVL
jgi:hypothetical protein